MRETQVLSRSERGRPQLEIVRGLHSGVHLDLSDGEYSFGPTPNADIVLRDGGVLAQHALLRVEGRQVRIEAIGGAVSVDGVNIAVGHGCRLRMPATLTIGEATLRLSRGAGADGMMKKLSGRPMEVAGGVLLCALAVTAVSEAMRSTPAEPSKSALTVSSAAVRPAAAPDTAATMKQAADELETRLRAGGLNGVRVVSQDQRISVQGRVGDAQVPQWTAIQQWFDEKYGSSTVLTSNVVVGQMTNTPLLRLQAIWYGERPYIIADNGARYYEGSVLDSGWILQRIGDDSLLLRKENESFSLSYR
jgi:hypothetical protein